MTKKIIPAAIAFCFILSGTDCVADKTIVAGKVSEAPVIDGRVFHKPQPGLYD